MSVALAHHLLVLPPIKDNEPLRVALEVDYSANKFVLARVGLLCVLV